MKTYPREFLESRKFEPFPKGFEEWRKARPGFTSLVMTFDTQRLHWQNLGWCGCVLAMTPPACYDACDNCLGYGVAPIGLMELKC